MLSVFEFVYKHNERVIGVLLGLILLTAIIYLIRSLGDKQQTVAATVSGVDLQALEGTLKRVLTQIPDGAKIPVETADASTDTDSAANGPVGIDPAVVASLEAQLSERNKKISDLEKAVQEAQNEAGVAAVAAAAAAEAVGTGGESPELQEKIKELEARLAEYAIIEDDIADLSLFKEENLRLKKEVEGLRANSPAAAKSAAGAGDSVMQSFESAVSSGVAPTATEEDVATSIDAELANVEIPKGDNETSASDLEADLGNLLGEISDEVSEPQNEEIAAAESLTASSTESSVETDAPAGMVAKNESDSESDSTSSDGADEVASGEDLFGGPLDTGKMMAEVADLEESATDDDALEGTLDTDKLLMEVDALNDDDAPAGNGKFAQAKEAMGAASKTVVPNSAPASPPVGSPISPKTSPKVNRIASNADEELIPGEDLFGEFNDEEKA